MTYQRPPLELFDSKSIYASSVCSDGAIPRKCYISPLYQKQSSNKSKKVNISSQFTLKKFITLDEIQELICYNFVKRSKFYADEALYNEKLLLYDKLIYQTFYTINEIYSFDNKKPEFELHPLFNWRKSIPANTPKSIVQLIEEMANNNLYKTSCCKLALAYEFMERLRINKFIDMCKNYRQHVLDNLYNEVYNEVMDNIGLSTLNPVTFKHYQVRSNISNYEKEGIDNSKLPLVRLGHDLKRNQTLDRSKILKARLLTARLGRFRKKYGFRVNRYFKDKESLLLNHIKIKSCLMDGWIREKSRSMHTYYTKKSNGRVSIKLRCKLPVEVIKIACVLREFDFSTEWIPFLKESQVLSSQSKGCYVVHHLYDYPVVGYYDMLLYFICINAMEETNSLFFISTSPPETYNEAEQIKAILKKHKIPDASSIVEYRENGNIFLEADLSKIKQEHTKQKAAHISFILYPIYDGKYTLLEMNASVVSSPYTPINLVSYISLKVAKGIVKGIYKICKNFSNSNFEKKMKENPEYYIWVGNQLRDSMGKFPPGLVEADPENSKIDVIEQHLTGTKADPSAYVDIDRVSIVTYS